MTESAHPVLPRLSGRVLVVGSGPNARPPADFPKGWTVATVNAAQANAWVGVPHLTMFGSNVLNNMPVNREAKRQLKNRRTRNLICVRGHRPITVKLRLWLLGYKADNRFFISQATRRDIPAALLGWTPDYARDNLISTGVALALISLHLGAKEVLMTGFSLSQDGHSYNNSGRERRHGSADELALRRAVELALPISTNDPMFAKESGLGLFEGISQAGQTDSSGGG